MLHALQVHWPQLEAEPSVGGATSFRFQSRVGGATGFRAVYPQFTLLLF